MVIVRAGYSMSFYFLAFVTFIPGLFLLCYARFIPARISHEERRQGGGRGY